MAVADLKNRWMSEPPALAIDALAHVMPGLKRDDALWLMEQLSPRALLRIAAGFMEAQTASAAQRT
ncbi:MAG TPA: hypothetical protein VFB81_16430 [Myxococcales bacterium]|nr:hypothetical protein [Myxococcales bacterium]